jgi:hypothetical protein
MLTIIFSCVYYCVFYFPFLQNMSMYKHTHVRAYILSRGVTKDEGKIGK